MKVQKSTISRPAPKESKNRTLLEVFRVRLELAMEPMQIKNKPRTKQGLVILKQISADLHRLRALKQIQLNTSCLRPASLAPLDPP
jgi:hypothetical protein